MADIGRLTRFTIQPIWRVARTLRQLHAITAVPADGSVFRRIERLLANAATLGLPLPAAAPDGLARLAAIEAARAADGRFGPGLSHNDFWSNNFLDDGERLWLVDWEFAGDGDGLFDLATLSLGASYSEAEQRTLLALYGASADDGLGQLRVMMIVVYCFEGAWALVQHGLRGSTGYDYAAHAERMFRRAAEADGA